MILQPFLTAIITSFVTISLFILKEKIEKNKLAKLNSEKEATILISINENQKTLNAISENLDFFEQEELLGIIEENFNERNIEEFFTTINYELTKNIIVFNSYSLSTSVYQEYLLKNPFNVEQNIDYFVILNLTNKIINYINKLNDAESDLVQRYSLLKAIYINIEEVKTKYLDVVRKKHINSVFD